jgi:hypothetical protein
MKTVTRFKIVGTEVIGLGDFLIILLALELRTVSANLMFQGLGWDFGIIGGTLILVGLEILSLFKRIPKNSTSD